MPCEEITAVLGCNLPAICLLVIVCSHDAAMEANVEPQIEAVGNVIEIAPDLGVRGIALGPLPFFQQLFAEGVAVGMALRIAACARLSVPVPGRAYARPR